MDKVAKDREEKAFRFTTFCVRRLKMGLEDGQIATEMGFQSAGMLYKQLELDGSPVCGTCGMLYPGPDHREEHETGKSKRKQRQPGVGGGHRVRLPDASGALGLFRHAVQSLEEYISIVASEESWLAGNVEEGGFKGKHFITNSVDHDAWEVARREEFTEEQWKELCEQQGVAPESDQFTLYAGSAATVGGVGRAPSYSLSVLVAAYALAGRPLTAPGPLHEPPLPALVEALHPDPDSADMEQVCVKLGRLRKAAGHLSRLVRGGVVYAANNVVNTSASSASNGDDAFFFEVRHLSSCF